MNVKSAMRITTLLMAVSVVVACAIIPRSGPNKREIRQGAIAEFGNSFIVNVTDRVIAAVYQPPEAGFGAGFRNASSVGSDVIHSGDILSLTIYENVDDGLLSTAGAPAQVPEVQVDQSGLIYVPYVGRVRADGNTIEQLRNIITRKLESQTPDPQVVVQRVAGDGSSVTIVGSTGAQGVFPIQASTSTLSAMLAKAGGVVSPPESTRITVIRGGKKGTVWLQQLYEDGRQDIALRSGDRILVVEDLRKFTVLGAASSQSYVPFPSPTLNAVEALGQIGGLNSSIADPTGIFVFRNEVVGPARKVLQRSAIESPQRIAYVLNLKEPNGIFMAREFQIRDGDTIYVTEAPYVQWTKILSVLTGSVGAANNLTN